MKSRKKAKKSINPEILREAEERYKTEALYSGEQSRKLLLLYALLAAGGAYATSGFGIGAGAVVPPILFRWLLD